ncbi:MAG: hypothetical protein EU535_06925 [Promethearchaeota archaeon]|nr:MAG: hypothetical protein EU535_06925 [Candidatus Lokiarchaeota archaeon]
MEEIEFTKERAKRSGFDMDEEELYAVGNMIRDIQLERKLEEKHRVLEEKDKVLEDKDELIKQLKEQLHSKN